MPITCPHNDGLLQLLYGSDVNLLQSIIFKAAQSIELTHRCQHEPVVGVATVLV